MSNIKPICIICKKSNGKLTTFKEKTLCKCKEVLKIRQENKLINNNVVIPEELNEFYGYHTDCYKRFTALPPKYRVSTSEPTVESSPSTSQEHDENQSDDSVTNTDSHILSVSQAVNDLTWQHIIGNLNDKTKIKEVVQDVPMENTIGEYKFSGEYIDEVVEDLRAILKKLTKNCIDVKVRIADDSNVKHMTCFYCGKIRKKIKGSEEKLSVFTKLGYDTVKKVAQLSNDVDMVKKLNDFPSDIDGYIDRLYHKSCKVAYNDSRQSILRNDLEKTDWHFTRDVRAEAYEVVEQFVLEKIIDGQNTISLKFLNDLFIDHLEKHTEDISDYTFKQYHLRERLLKKFRKKINFINCKDQTFVIPYTATAT
ncbi:PREDICTED: uncharacterized protein LOC107064526 [Polistes dominula]|uniref:Uncharacterized protein LOC107064526 n=1 Tax=Polistes dominula TaxID=743375 RepID=A0ABM1HXS5_POLDO|nr:PREDICTED: uncharacterized protein LOC107064526 [Polistes dominula]